MGSNGSISAFGKTMMPFLAILRHDLRSLWDSRLVRLWMAAAVLVSLVLTAGNWGQFRTGALIASLFVPFLVFPWFLVVMVLGINPVSGSRAEALADGVLSRPVTRYEYLVATWLARVLMVLGVFLLSTVPLTVLIALARRPAATDAVTVYGVVAALGVVGLVLTLQVSLGFMFGTLLRRPLTAIVVLLFLWYPINFTLDFFRLEQFSPVSLNRALSMLVRQPWRDSGAEPAGLNSDEMQELLGQLFVNALTFQKQQPEPKPFFEGTEFRDFSLWQVALGYGVPTLLAIGLTTICFCRRDL